MLVPLKMRITKWLMCQKSSQVFSGRNLQEMHVPLKIGMTKCSHRYEAQSCCVRSYLLIIKHFSWRAVINISNCVHLFSIWCQHITNEFSLCLVLSSKPLVAALLRSSSMLTETASGTKAQETFQCKEFCYRVCSRSDLWPYM